MPYIASNNGISWRWFDESENHALADGEVDMGGEAPTEDQLRSAFPDYDTAMAAHIEAMKPKEPTKAELAAQLQELAEKIAALP